MTTYTAHCKFCGKKYEIKSEWLPDDILDLIIEIKLFFHAIRHHYKECGFKKIAKAFFRILKNVFKCIGIILLLLIKIILYPIYLLLDLLYRWKKKFEEVSWLPLFFVPGRIVKILIIKKSVDKVKEVCYTLITIRKGNKRFTNF